MAFIGNTNTTQAFTPAIDYFSGTGSATAFTLSRPVASVAQVQVTIDNVAQNPSSAYTISGSTITFTSAPLSGTNNIYVYYTSPITQVIAPGQSTVGLTQLNATGTPSSSNFLRGDNAWSTLSRSNLPAGTVLQVVNATYSTTVSSTTDTYIDTGLTATITPTSASSKILVLVSINDIEKNNNTYAGFKLLRNATEIMVFANEASYTNTTAVNSTSVSCNYLDSPTSTSATTYKVQFRSVANISLIYVQTGAKASSNITLMEIAA